MRTERCLGLVSSGKSPHRRRGIVRHVAAAVLLAMIVGLVARGWLSSREARARYGARLAAIRLAGEPLTSADFARLHPVPLPQCDLSALLRDLPPLKDVGALWSPPFPPSPTALSPDDVDALRLAVGSNRPSVDRLLAMDLSRHAISLDRWTKGFHADNDTLFRRIEISRVLALEVLYRAETGDSGRAVAAMERGLEIARAPGAPGFMGAVGRLACEAMLLAPLERLLQRAVLDEDHLRRLARVCEPRSDILPSALLFERAANQWWCGHLLDVPLPSRPKGYRPLQELPHLEGTGFDLLRWWRPGFRDRLCRLERYTERLDACRLPASAQLAALHAIDQRYQAEVRRYARFLLPVAGLFALGDRLEVLREPNFVVIASDDLVTRALFAASQTAIALELWRLRHGGAVPSDLARLVPEYLPAVPLDPWDGRPLRYRPGAEGYLLCSVGSDLTDDQGERSPGRRGETPGTDITFARDFKPGT